MSHLTGLGCYKYLGQRKKPVNLVGKIENSIRKTGKYWTNLSHDYHRKPPISSHIFQSYCLKTQSCEIGWKILDKRRFSNWGSDWLRGKYNTNKHVRLVNQGSDFYSQTKIYFYLVKLLARSNEVCERKHIPPFFIKTCSFPPCFIVQCILWSLLNRK